MRCLDLNLTLKQKQVMSQQMQLSVRILQMNSLDLNQYMQETALENPLMELEVPAEEDPQVERLKKLEWLESMDESSFYRSAYNSDSDKKEHLLYEKKTVDTLEDTLLLQLPGFKLSPPDERIVRYLIGNLDENGYLKIAPAQLASALQADEAAIERGLGVLHSMEPGGVGAADLRECLLIQARRLSDPSPALVPLIENHLDLLAKNQLEKLAKALGVNIGEVKAARAQLLELNPKPGNGYSSYNSIPYIRPDLFIVHFEDKYQIILNDYNQPRISVNSGYRNLMKQATPEENKYIRSKILQVEQLSYCIQQRKNTILGCAEKILRWQIRFFEEGPGNMVPMTLADIAEQMNLHPSTISRAVKGKYLQCQWGVFALSEFFSRAVSEQEQSQDMVLVHIRSIISGEDSRKPYSDQRICELLAQRGVNIARRTVAKYRESMGIAPASQRKNFE